MINLKKYPLGEIHRGQQPKVFVVRIARSLPLKMEGLCEEILLASTKSVDLYSISTEQRTLGYIIKFKRKPVLRHKWNYAFFFYGKTISKVKIIYQDSSVRMAKSGNENFVGFVLKTKSKSKPEELPGDEDNDE